MGAESDMQPLVECVQNTIRGIETSGAHREAAEERVRTTLAHGNQRQAANRSLVHDLSVELNTGHTLSFGMSEDVR